MKVGDVVTFKGCCAAAQITSIDGKMAAVDHCGEILRKRLSSLKPYVRKSAYWNEQEIAHLSQKYAHGQEVYSVLSIDGDGGVFVWDEYKQAVVRKDELS